MSPLEHIITHHHHHHHYHHHLLYTYIIIIIITSYTVISSSSSSTTSSPPIHLYHHLLIGIHQSIRTYQSVSQVVGKVFSQVRSLTLTIALMPTPMDIFPLLLGSGVTCTSINCSPVMANGLLYLQFMYGVGEYMTASIYSSMYPSIHLSIRPSINHPSNNHNN